MPVVVQGHACIDESIRLASWDLVMHARRKYPWDCILVQELLVPNPRWATLDVGIRREILAAIQRILCITQENETDTTYSSNV